jgi:hypothetical protein
MKYQHLPTIVEAVQFDGTEKSIDEIEKLGAKINDYWKHECKLGFETIDGRSYVIKGDWVIKGVMGEFYPCKTDAFKLSYEKAKGSEK